MGGLAVFVEPKNLSYEDFPASDLAPEGMHTARADRTPRLCKLWLDVEYARKDGVPLRLSVVRPPLAEGDETTFPLVMFVQGSAWRKQQLGNSLPGLMRFAARGYVVAVVEYRPSDVAPFPAQILDTKTAIRYMRKNAAQYAADPGRLAVWGDSSGGHTAVMTAVTADDPGFVEPSEQGEPSGLRACVDYYGPSDIARMNEVPSNGNHLVPDSPEGMLIGGLDIRENREKADATSPMRYISPDKKLPPTLIMHGDKDRAVPFAQSALLYEALVAAGQEVEFWKLSGADHGGDAFFTDEVLDIVESFLEEHCG